jgi:anhydro-N-acetylmuramic acid kinase
VAFLNIGGIANISCIKHGIASGFDTGPGNTLMDAWIRRHKGLDFDRNGAWAKAGSLDEKLLKTLLADPYFHRAAPKSTGQDHFNLAWLSALLTDSSTPEDVQRTLLELTAVTASAALLQSGSQSVFTFGGGRHNDFLMARIQDLLGGLSVSPTSKLGVDPDFMEATAFAWLAKQCLDGKPGNDPAVTGARGERVLGVVFPA